MFADSVTSYPSTVTAASFCSAAIRAWMDCRSSATFPYCSRRSRVGRM